MNTLELPMASTYVDPSRRELIAEKAYILWLDRGCPDDSAERDWLDAERQIDDDTFATSEDVSEDA